MIIKGSGIIEGKTISPISIKQRTIKPPVSGYGMSRRIFIGPGNGISLSDSNHLLFKCKINYRNAMN